MHFFTPKPNKGHILAIAIYILIGCQDAFSDKTTRQHSTANGLVADSRPKSEDASPADDSDKTENKGESDSNTDDADEISDGANPDSEHKIVTVVTTSTVTAVETSTDDTTCVIVGPKPDPKSLDPLVLASCDKFVLVQIQCDWLPPKPKQGDCHVFKKNGKKSIPNGSAMNCEELRKVLIDTIN